MAQEKMLQHEQRDEDSERDGAGVADHLDQRGDGRAARCGGSGDVVLQEGQQGSEGE